MNRTKHLFLGTDLISVPNPDQPIEEFIQSIVAEAKTRGVMGKKKDAFALTIIEATPALASYLLDNLYERQRDNSDSRVAQYIQDVVSNAWPMFGDPIHIDTSGKMINGQRRCHTIVRTNRSMKLILVVTSDPRAYSVMDSLQPRNTRDQYFALTGDKLPSNALTAMVFEMDDFVHNKQSAVMRAMRAMEYDQREAVNTLLSFRDPNVRMYAGRLAGALRCVRHDPKKAFEFFEAVFGYKTGIRGREVPVIHDLYSAWIEVETAGPRWGHPKKILEAHYTMEAFRFWLESPRSKPARLSKRATHGLPGPGETKPYVSPFPIVRDMADAAE